MSDFILHALSLSGNGAAEELPHQDLIQHFEQTAHVSWLHFDANNPEAKTWLEESGSGIDDSTVEALLAEETRPRYLAHNEGALLNLRGVNLNQDSQPEDMVSIRLWIEEKRIISLRRNQIRAVQDIRQHLQRGEGPKNAGEFITQLVDKLFDRMEPVFTELEDNLDELEEKVNDNPGSDERIELTELRRRTLLLRRYIAPQRDAISGLRQSTLPWLSDEQRRELHEAQDRVTRYLEDLDTIRERAQIVKDELTTVLSDKMNKNLYMLSVVAAIFLPLGFLTGLLGINVGGIPGSENPLAFAIFCGILVVVVGLQLWFFKKSKWF